MMMDRMLAATVEIDVPAGPDAEGARRATEVAGPASTSRVRPPDPEVPAKVQRRRFSAEYRLRILKCHRSPNNPPLWSLKTPHLDS